MTQQEQQLVYEIEFFWYEGVCCCRNNAMQQSLNAEIMPSPLRPFWAYDSWQAFCKEYNQVIDNAQTRIRARERWIFALWFPCWCLALAGMILTGMTEEEVEHVDPQTGDTSTTRDYDVHVLLPIGFAVCFVMGYWLFAYTLRVRKQYLSDPWQALAGRYNDAQKRHGLAVVAQIPNQINKARKRRYVLQFSVASTNALQIMARV